MQNKKYLDLFIEESRENLQKLNDSLPKLKNNSENIEILNDIFRIVHTITGMSKAMDFNDIGNLTHNMENVLEDIRKGKLKTNKKIINILFNCSNKLQELIDEIIANTYQENANNMESLLKTLQELFDKPGSPKKKKKRLTETLFDQFEISLMDIARGKGLNTIEISVNIVPTCVLLGARAYMVVKELETYGEIIKTCPDVEDLENGDYEKEFRLYILTNRPKDKIKSNINNIFEVDYVEIKDIDINNKPENPDNKETNEKAKINQPCKTKADDQTIRVSSDKLNSLINLLEKLLINKTRVAQLSSERQLNDLSSVVDTMGNITTDIQEIIMKLRMVPIDQVFSRFPRLVRDVSKSLNKDIDLKITGKDTKIDRVLIEEIGDPIVHLVRNSLDHGIETPEERAKNGKPTRGTIELSAFKEKDKILIRVSDDGKGISPEKIETIAIKKGLITREDAEKLTNAEKLDLIFLPGLSSAEVTTDISGRGVGMDVVKTTTTTLGGHVSISSKIGMGTEITICLPSTFDMIDELVNNEVEV